MKKSTFSPTKIAGILKEFTSGRSAEELARKLASARPLYTSGVKSTTGWKPVNSSG